MKGGGEGNVTDIFQIPGWCEERGRGSGLPRGQRPFPSDILNEDSELLTKGQKTVQST